MTSLIYLFKIRCPIELRADLRSLLVPVVSDGGYTNQESLENWAHDSLTLTAVIDGISSLTRNSWNDQLKFF